MSASDLSAVSVCPKVKSAITSQDTAATMETGLIKPDERAQARMEQLAIRETTK